MSYENAPVMLAHGRHFVCGSQPSGSREAEGDLKQTLRRLPLYLRHRKRNLLIFR